MLIIILQKMSYHSGYIYAICHNLNYDASKLNIKTICANMNLSAKRVISTDADMDVSTEYDARIIFGDDYDEWSDAYKNKVKHEIALTYMG